MHVLEILGSSFIVEVAKILVDKEAAIAATQKDKRILLETTNKMHEEVFELVITKLLHTYMTFTMDSLDFFLASLKEIIIHKNNSIHIFLNPSFDIPILPIWSNRLDKLL